jgi:type I restriction enzyme, R subunit
VVVPSPAPSPNFAYLAYHDPRLTARAAAAERFFAEDPATCLMNLRVFGELLAKRAAAKLGIALDPRATQVDVLRALSERGALGITVCDLFHRLRIAGNDAAHEAAAEEAEALHQLKMARELGIWFQRTFGNNRKFDPGPFVPPPSAGARSPGTEAELERLRQALGERQAEAEAGRQQLEAALASAEQEQALRLSAQERAEREAEQRALWETLAAEGEHRSAAAAAEYQEQVTALNQRLDAELQKQQAQAAQRAPEERQAAVEVAAQLGEEIELDEPATRRLIDQQLRDAGWEADTIELSYAQGARPEKGKNRAIAEWPTRGASGKRERADYALFAGLTAVGVVEAKRQRLDVHAALDQSKRYSRGFEVRDGALTADGAPWREYRVPFLFATNARPYLEQLRTKSGIWFWDARRGSNASRALRGWYTPEGLLELLKRDAEAAHEQLRREPLDYLPLRDYQVSAIHAVEAAIEAGQRACLVAMATGTGKTRMAIGLVYRLIKAQRFRRILFLVDRTALGEQTQDAFATTRLEQLQAFTEIFDLKKLDEPRPDPDTKLHMATVQGLVKRILYPACPDEVPAVDAYDCIVVDECHRGYGLDREMNEAELRYRNFADYISKYRRVLDHFDAVKIGLTATPALHTTEIFGEPTARYTYREAVIDGYLVDHEPPLSLVTELSEHGIHWDKGDEVQVYDPKTQTIDLLKLEDEVDIEIDSFNKRVITESFNRVVCNELARHIDPTSEAKTLVFCVTDEHADLVVGLLRDAFRERYGELDEDAVAKITGAADQPLQLIRRYKNERLPNVAVTVDLLTTGIDVPKISNLVFLRRVRSRILYEQMLGRATRLCDEIGKASFRVFDPVKLYEALEAVTEMNPVAPATRSFEDLWRELEASKPQALRELALEQLIAKLQRKRRSLAGESLARFEAVAGMSPAELCQQLKHQSLDATSRWLHEHAGLAPLLEYARGEQDRVFISDHQDQILRVERGYGAGKKPDDYLDEFKRFIDSHLNEIPALLVVSQRPQSLTREALRELALRLDNEGFSEARLSAAWRDKTNVEIAAGIVGFIRQAAIGDPLVAYEERVERAVKKLLARQPWTQPQRAWLQRIGARLGIARVLDRDALDQEEPFKGEGGARRLDKVFDGQLDALLAELQTALWESAS